MKSLIRNKLSLRRMKVKSTSFIILMLLLLLNSCSKDEYSGDEFRVKEWRTYFKDDLVEYTYLKYSGDRLTAIYTEGFDYKIEVEYPSVDSIIANQYKHYDESELWTPYKKYIMVTDNGKIVGSDIYVCNPHEDKWYQEWKYTYSYLDSLLVEAVTYMYDVDQWVPALRQNINYDNGRKVGSLGEIFQISTGEWSYNSQSEYIYTNDILYQVLTDYYSGNEVYESKTETYSYQDGSIVEISLNRINHGTELPEMIFTFDYDTFGNMTGRTVGTPDVDFRTEYTYERGKGNSQQLFHLGYTNEPNTVLPWSFFSVTGK
jgi:hypothetical protein